MIGTGQHSMRSSDAANSQYCSICTAAKQCKASNRGNMAYHSLSTAIAVGMIGPMPPESIGGKPYCLTMDMLTHRYVRVDLMKSREEAA